MTSPDRLRSRIHQKLEELIGPEEADTLVEAMLPVPWREVATKHDLRALESALRGEIAELRGEIAELRGEMHGSIDALRGEMHGSIASVRGEIAQLRGEVHGSFESVRRELHQALATQTRWFAGFNVALAAVIITVIQLLP